MSKVKIAIWSTAVLVVVFLGAVAAVGYPVFGQAKQDPLERVDAVVVLGGEHDGREQYGLQLAKEGYAPTLVLSNPYEPDDHVMAPLCDRRVDGIEVLCEVPDPSTTRGEALFTERLARERGWKKVIVVSWRYHLPRSRYIFGNCFAGETVMRAVPREYAFGPADWELIYLYQSFAMAKAMVQGGC
ncbi:hypothetical protein TPAU25S_03583 [Tsukamurella paurometabola]|uniref:DUF218 domain-containing protein n=1 Tax=Tsukamurella paurometabola (strain ATCC 8368 / DSM 20162 / CCUG 35730 / CIP 100753 / JCM 10117 / KCTC 9821 / NBRC 16120 / NCIMB 702349 / NCTC 13040) TaxID=521096 RepID=D5UPT5_TSUPD|nr:YdcF family protein [Tsukamurella paurometabola]ADG76703.1 protein of unknown function DUF218 [Tsukamurella paurometabola DSM 20162]SUP41288.1 DUF218 domain [Tsukamurella paurometabola]